MCVQDKVAKDATRTSNGKGAPVSVREFVSEWFAAQYVPVQSASGAVRCCDCALASLSRHGSASVAKEAKARLQASVTLHRHASLCCDTFGRLCAWFEPYPDTAADLASDLLTALHNARAVGEGVARVDSSSSAVLVRATCMCARSVWRHGCGGVGVRCSSSSGTCVTLFVSILLVSFKRHSLKRW